MYYPDRKPLPRSERRRFLIGVVAITAIALSVILFSYALDVGWLSFAGG